LRKHLTGWFCVTFSILENRVAFLHTLAVCSACGGRCGIIAALDAVRAGQGRRGAGMLEVFQESTNGKG
jgi:hypothetical protein